MNNRDWVEIIAGKDRGIRGVITSIDKVTEDCDVLFLKLSNNPKLFKTSSYFFDEIKLLVPATPEKTKR